MTSFSPKTGAPRTSLFVLAALLSCLLPIPPRPIQAEAPHAEMAWILRETLVNPNEAERKFRGGGGTENWYTDPRYEGKSLEYQVTETSFSIHDVHVDWGHEYHNVTVETFFAQPPPELNPGETVELPVGFAHFGTAEDEGVGVLFQYHSDDVAIDPDMAFGYAPWKPGFSGETETMFGFVVPPATAGATLEISAGWWNAEPCLVIWRYTAAEVSAEADERGFQEPEVIGEVEIDPDDYVSSPDTLAGHAIALVGDVTVISDGQEKPLFRSDPIWLGSCIKTGDRGRVRIRMNDVTVDDEWVDQQIPGNSEYIRDVYREQGDVNPLVSRIRGPSYINMGSNSQLCFYSMRINWREKPSYSGLLGLIEGQARVFLKNWGVNTSFDVRAGVAVCGIRGSDVIIQHYPEEGFVHAMVREGHMDVTLETTGETESLYDRSSMIISNREIVLLSRGDMEEETWDRYVEDLGLSDEDMPDTALLAPEETQEDLAQPSDADRDRSYEAERGNVAIPTAIIVALGVLGLGTVILIAIIVGVVLLRRKRSRQGS